MQVDAISQQCSDRVAMADLTPRRSRQTQLIYLSRIRGSCQEQANRRFFPCNSTIARAMAAANCFLCGISSQC